MHCGPRSTSLKHFRLGALLLLLAGSLIGCASLERVNRGTGVVRDEPQPVTTSQGNATVATSAALIAQALNTAQVGAQNPLIDAVRRAVPAPLSAGNRITPLIDGPAAFAAMDRAVAAARHSVNVETYIFSDDSLGRSFATLLMEKARAGVIVRLIYDAIGSRDTPGSLFDEMRAAGVQVAEFRPLNLIKTLPWRYHNRDHRKLLVIDDRLAFTGGLNISGAYSVSSTSRPGPELGLTAAWRDTHVQIEGPAVAQFQAIFFETWERLTERNAEVASSVVLTEAPGHELVTAVVSNGVRQRDEDIYTAYLAAVTHAQQRIWITQAYFSPPTELRKALFAAVKRGVDVRVLLPGFTDSSVVFYASRADYDKFLRHGVRLYEKTDALLHAKSVVIDDAVTMIGSANLDYRSFLHNNEVTALIIGNSTAQRMQDVFKTDIADAYELTLEEWRKRSLGQRIKERLSHWFNYWL